MISDKELQNILQSLRIVRASGTRLTTRNYAYVRGLFQTLKKSYTNEEIYTLTTRRWSLATIKRYTKGVGTEKQASTSSDDESPEQDPVPLVLTADGYSADQVREAHSALQLLQKHNVSLESVLSVINIAVANAMPSATIVSTLKDLTAASIPVPELRLLIDLRKSLTQLGLTTKLLEQLLKVISKYGSTETIVEGLDALGGLRNIQSQTANAKSQNEELTKANERVYNEMRATEAKRKAVEDALFNLQELESIGFAKQAFEDLVAISNSLGASAPELIAAVKDYIENHDLAAAKIKLEEEMVKMNTQLQELKMRYAHFANAASMIDKLVELGFNQVAIEKIYGAAQNFGEPHRMLEAIAQFGQHMKSGVDLEQLRNFPKVMRENESLALRIKELEERTKTFEEIKRERDELVKANKDKITTAFQIVEEVMDQLDKPNPAHRVYRKEVMDSGMALQIEEAIEKAASRRIVAAQDTQLVSVFRSAANRIIEGWSYLWPKEKLGLKTDEKVARLKQVANMHPLVVLKGEWKIPCNTCILGHYLKLASTFDVENLIRKGQVISGHDSIYPLNDEPPSIVVSLRLIVEMCLIKSIYH